MKRVNEGEDIIDSRDIIEKIEELESELDSIKENAGERWDDDPTKQAAWTREVYIADSVKGEFSEDDTEDLERLKELLEDVRQASGEDPKYGAQLIADRYFEEYARELAEDIGAIGKDLPWPACHIDWEAAADALKQDYSSVQYGDTEYWVRS